MVKFAEIFSQHIPCDIFNLTIEQLSDRLKFKDPDYVNLWLYQYDYRLIGDDFPIHFDVLKHKDKIIQILKKISESSFILLCSIFL